MSKAKQPIPEGYHTLTPYLTVTDVKALLAFLEKAFGATETYRMARPDGTIRHAEVRIEDSMVMMGQCEDPKAARPGTLYMYVADADAVYARALAAGGVSIKAPTTQDYGDRSGAVEDPVGNQWWIATRVEDVSAEEIERRARSSASGRRA
jgi:uncharacterized glyoxalase superfamily protein PhnB